MGADYFHELSNAIGHAAIIPHYYLAFSINDIFTADKDLDTQHGQQVRQLFVSATSFASSYCPFGDVAFSVTLYDSNHFVCLVRADTAATMGVVAGRLTQLLSQHFAEHRTTDRPHNQRISFALDSDRCCLVQGGARGQHNRSLSPASSRIEHGLLVNPDHLRTIVDDYYDGEPPASPRPVGRDLERDLEYDEYDRPWVAHYLRCIHDTMIQAKSSLSTWKQVSRSLPSSSPVDALGNESTKHRIGNRLDLERFIREHNLQ
eukprot:4018471-Amphidinium_carterae.1